MTRGEAERLVGDVIVAETNGAVSRSALETVPITALGDSLALLLVVLAIEKRAGIDLAADVMHARTVGDLVDAVERARPKSAARPIPTARIPGGA